MANHFNKVCPPAPRKQPHNTCFHGEPKNMINEFLVCPPAPRKQPCAFDDSHNGAKKLPMPRILLHEFDNSLVCPPAPRKRLCARTVGSLVEPRNLLSEFLVCPPAPKKLRVKTSWFRCKPRILLNDFSVCPSAPRKRRIGVASYVVGTDIRRNLFSH